MESCVENYFRSCGHYTLWDTLIGNQGSNDFRTVSGWEAFCLLLVLWSTHWGFLEVKKDVFGDPVLIEDHSEQWQLRAV